MTNSTAERALYIVQQWTQNKVVHFKTACVEVQQRATLMVQDLNADGVLKKFKKYSALPAAFRRALMGYNTPATPEQSEEWLHVVDKMTAEAFADEDALFEAVDVMKACLLEVKEVCDETEVLETARHILQPLVLLYGRAQRHVWLANLSHKLMHAGLPASYLVHGCSAAEQRHPFPAGQPYELSAAQPLLKTFYEEVIGLLMRVFRYAHLEALLYAIEDEHESFVDRQPSIDNYMQCILHHVSRV